MKEEKNPDIPSPRERREKSSLKLQFSNKYSQNSVALFSQLGYNKDQKRRRDLFGKREKISQFKGGNGL